LAANDEQLAATFENFPDAGLNAGAALAIV
jgi:hypothetical protein